MKENQEKWESLFDIFEQYRETLEVGGAANGRPQSLTYDDEYFSYENYLKRKEKQNKRLNVVAAQQPSACKAIILYLN